MEETGWTYNFSQFYHMVANLIWNIEKMSLSKLVGGTNQKGIQKGIGLRQKDSVRDRLEDWFAEA